jgi:threonylcarbamoyladenosine tRNA methylthiotransferase MtaB
MVVPNDEKDVLLRLLDERFGQEHQPPENQPRGGFPEPIPDWFPENGGACGLHLAPGAMGRTAYPLRVQTGCDQACAFCIIPSTRGSSRSREVAEICGEVQRIAAAGYKEVWLVGVHLGSFGRDRQPATSLVALLRDLDRQPGDVTFRISSLEPMDCPPDLIDLVVRSGRFAPHFHLPLQHASDRVLQAMRRPYAFEDYRDLVDRIRTRLPHASIGSDLIAGFPGECDEDVDLMARAVEQLPLSYLHVFPYSDRPGTEATAMMPKVDPGDIKTRARRMRDVAKRLSDRFVASQVGSVRPGLTLDDGTVALTDNFLKLRIPPGLPRNTRVLVRIESVALDGSVVT